MVWGQESQPGGSDGAALALCAEFARRTSQTRDAFPAIPEFLRIAWASDEAREIFEPQIESVAKAWETVEWRSADVLRPCAMIDTLSTNHAAWIERISEARLSWDILRVVDATPPGASQPVLSSEIVVGSRRNVRAFRAAWIRRDSDAMGALLGYPRCCRAFFQAAYVESRIADYTWLIGRATRDAHVRDSEVSVPATAETNILLRRLGIRALPHFPCTFACELSIELSGKMTALASSLGYGDEMRQLNEMLDWPLRWTARHGIAEVLTPVLKFVTHSHPTRETFALNWLGETVPAQAARGLRFPFRSPTVEGKG
ncbi:MAG TPA: hypothetical protein VMD53_15220 [Rhizomicrobium sp.]|nr:hypothetical protein [Rhizomicrobium sp.]